MKDEEMFGETNQTPDSEDLFDPTEIQEDDIQPTSEDDIEDNDGEEKPVAKTQTPEGKKIKLKYNGAEQELDVETDYDRLVELAQKGMNYDHVNQEKEALKNSEEFQFLEEMAKDAGVKDRKEFIKKMREDIQNTKITGRAEELMDEGMSREHALYTAKLEVESKSQKPQTPEVDPSAEFIESAKKGFENLYRVREDLAKIPFESYPEDVKSMIVQQGFDPLAAWTIHEKKAQEVEFQKLQQQIKSKERDLGNLGSKGKEEKPDDFMSGFNL